MFGIELTEIFFFIRQLGFSAAGAASLWGLVFYYKHKRAQDDNAKTAWEHLIRQMLIPLAIGIVVGTGASIVLYYIILNMAHAHVGIVITPTAADLARGTFISLFLTAWLILFSIIGYSFIKSNWEKVKEKMHLFYVGQFITLSLLVSIPLVTNEFGKEMLFFIGHNWHSILTFGTVAIVDFLFAIPHIMRGLDMNRYVYPFFPTMSKAIWIGLGIELLSVLLIFDEALRLTPKFYFMQTVVAIILINGIILSGPITRKLLSLIHGDQIEELAGRWNIAASFCGVLSITSWTTITVVDAFKNLSLSYWQLMAAYGIFLAFGYFAFFILEHNRLIQNKDQ